MPLKTPKLNEEEIRFYETVQTGHGRTFKWLSFLFSLFLIAIGSMLVYESSNDPIYDTSQNNGLIGMGGVSLVLSFLLLIALVYVEKKYPDISLKFFYAVVFMIMFGTTVGTISVINGVDVPNLGSRATLGWALGGITTAIGVLSFFLTGFALIALYSQSVRNTPFTIWLFGDPRDPHSKTDEQMLRDDGQDDEPTLDEKIIKLQTAKLQIENELDIAKTKRRPPPRKFSNQQDFDEYNQRLQQIADREQTFEEFEREREVAKKR